MVDVRPMTHPDDFAALPSDELRRRLVVDDLFGAGEVRWALSQQDRLLIGGAMPAGAELRLDAPDAIKADALLDRRELGVVCLAGSGTVTVDGDAHELAAEDILYVGRGSTELVLAGDDAVYYLVCAPAHESHPTTRIRKDEAQSAEIGEQRTASLRTLRKYVHDQGVQSATLALGITTIEPGNVWNTMPCHTHDRRTEVYLYFDVPADERVVHLYGRPDATRSVIMADRQAVINPPWSVHFGAGTAPYRFVWSTSGENLSYTDMDFVDTASLA